MFKKGATSRNFVRGARRRRAFPLSELLVVIVIITLLMAVLIPTVQMVHGRSRNPRKRLPR